MSTISDILKVLDKIPIWGKLKTLPDIVEDLETRIKRIENKLEGKSGKLCPKCGSSNYTIAKSYPDPQFKFAGKNRIIYKCPDCGHTRQAVE